VSLSLNRRTALLGAAASIMLAACASGPSSSGSSSSLSSTTPTPPIVFVHGNGDTAALWLTTEWRFESNGWPRNRLYAVDIPYPTAREDDTKPQEGRSSTTENMQYLSAEVDKVLRATGATKVVLIANSRGGYAVRNYIQNGGGADKVSHAILSGTPNHGVFFDSKIAPNGEFNGAAPFLSGLNAPKGPNGDEVTAGVKWMTIRSDVNDKFAQPDGVWLGAKGMKTNVTSEGPALKGAENVVIPGIDHRETAYSEKAFEQMFRFITGKPPAVTSVTREANVVLDGKVSGYGVANAKGTSPSNLPLVGATVEVYPTNPTTGERVDANTPAYRKTIGADGMWGPFTADPSANYEFVITAASYSTTHIYRSPFPRSSNIVNMRAERLLAADKDAMSVVILARPRGYFGLPRDRITLDGNPPPGVPPGTPGVSESKLKMPDGATRPIVGTFDDERVIGWAWPVLNNEIVILELTY
jgi:triacylglycerol lipase